MSVSVGSAHELLQRLPHHLGVALEDAPAADGEQRVADEGDLGRRYQIADVAERVAGRVEHLDREVAELDDVALADLAVDPGNASASAAGPMMVQPVSLLERQVAAGVVAVVMRDQNDA